MPTNAANTAISGLRAQNKRLETIADNVANVSTPFYKVKETIFQTFVTGETTPGGVRTSHRQHIDRQGIPLTTEGQYDISIGGPGFLAFGKYGDVPVGGSQEFVFSRGGQLSPDSNGLLRSPDGRYLLGWATDQTGTPLTVNKNDLNALVPINVNPNQVVFEQTTQITTILNQPANAIGGNDVDIKVIDSLGLSHNVSLQMTKQIAGAALPGAQALPPAATAPAAGYTPAVFEDNEWVVSISATDLALVPTAHTVTRSGGGAYDDPNDVIIARFKTDGTLDGFYELNKTAITVDDGAGGTVVLPIGSVKVPVQEGGGVTNGLPDMVIDYANTSSAAANSTISLDMGNFSSTVRLATAVDPGSAFQPTGVNVISANGSTTQQGTKASKSYTQDGISAGGFAGVSISNEGVIQALFSNGQFRALYKLPLGSVANPNGMSPHSGNVYTPTDTSGELTLFDANTEGMGQIINYSLEGSTVDIAGQFTTMIQTQQFYVANTKVIQVNSEIDRVTTELVGR